MGNISRGKRLITYAWFTIMLFVFMALISAIALAVNNDCNREDCSKSKAFAGAWVVVNLPH